METSKIIESTAKAITAALAEEGVKKVFRVGGIACIGFSALSLAMGVACIVASSK